MSAHLEARARVDALIDRNPDMATLAVMPLAKIRDAVDAARVAAGLGNVADKVRLAGILIVLAAHASTETEREAAGVEGLLLLDRLADDCDEAATILQAVAGNIPFRCFVIAADRNAARLALDKD